MKVVKIKKGNEKEREKKVSLTVVIEIEACKISDRLLSYSCIEIFIATKN